MSCMTPPILTRTYSGGAPWALRYVTANVIVVVVVAVVGLTSGLTSEVGPAAVTGSAEAATSSAAARAARNAGRPSPLVIAPMTAWVLVTAVCAACSVAPNGGVPSRSIGAAGAGGYGTGVPNGEGPAAVAAGRVRRGPFTDRRLTRQKWCVP